MTDDLDNLERELQALRPRGLTSGFLPETQARLASRTLFFRRARVALLVMTAAAACLVIVLVVRHPAPAPPPIAPVLASHDPYHPTLSEYSRAWQRSPESLDALLREEPAPAPGPEHPAGVLLETALALH